MVELTLFLELLLLGIILFVNCNYIFSIQIQTQQKMQSDSLTLDQIYKQWFNPNTAKNWDKINEEYRVDYNTPIKMGRYGKVYRGFSIYKNHMVSIKISQKGDQQTEQIIHSLQSNSLLNNPYIFSYHGHQVKDQKIFVFMELCPFGTLKDLIREKPSEIKVLKLFRQLVQGMKYFNQTNKIHKDLIPQHILLGPEKDIKICDFGLDKQESCSIFQTGNMGTALYSAPEVFFTEGEKEDKHSEKCDVWSAGLILYEMLTGFHLFKRAQNFDDLKDEWLQFEKGREVRIGEGQHPAWQWIIEWMLAFRPENRPSFDQVNQQLRQLYFPMKQQINDKKTQFSQELQKFTTHLRSHTQKYQFLLDLCQQFTNKDIRLRNEFKYLIIFCCLMRYLSFCKYSIPQLLERSVGSQKTISQVEIKKDAYLTLLVGRKKAEFEQRYAFYHRQVRSAIVPKILGDYLQRQNSQFLMEDMNNVVELVKLVDRGQPQGRQEVYDEALQSILRVIELRQGDVTKCFNLDELQLYCKLIIAMLLTQKYSGKDDQQESIGLQLVNIGDLSKEALINKIKGLADQVC